jgi:hypothetical protein
VHRRPDFVSDGHHRVSIAVATGQQTIDASMTEILTAKPFRPTTRTLPPDPLANDPEQLFRAAARP